MNESGRSTDTLDDSNLVDEGEGERGRQKRVEEIRPPEIDFFAARRARFRAEGFWRHAPDVIAG